MLFTITFLPKTLKDNLFRKSLIWRNIPSLNFNSTRYFFSLFYYLINIEYFRVSSDDSTTAFIQYYFLARVADFKVLPLDIRFRIADKSAFEGDGVTVVGLSNHRSFGEGRFNTVFRYGCLVAYVRHKRSTYRELFVHTLACLLNPFAATINIRSQTQVVSSKSKLPCSEKIFILIKSRINILQDMKKV